MPNLLTTNRNYFCLWLGQATASIGNKIYLIALSWYFINELRSANGLTAMLCAGTFPILLFGPFAGPYIDRWDRRRIMITSDLVCCALTLGVAGVVHWHASPLLIYGLVFLLGITSVFFMPATRALVPCLVSEEQIQQATSLHAGVTQLATLLGAALGGIVVGWWGVLAAVLINVATYAISAFTSLLIRHRDRPAPREQAPSVLAELLEGVRYVRDKSAILRLLCVAALFNIFFMAIFVLLPILISDYLKLSASAFGTAESVLSAGSIAAALILALRDVKSHLVWVKLGLALSGLGFLLLAVGRAFPFVLVAMALFGFMMNLVNINAISFFTKTVASAFHGRFFNLMETISSGTFPLSFLLAGQLVQHVSVYWLFIVNGLAMLLLGLLASLSIRSQETICST